MRVTWEPREHRISKNKIYTTGCPLFSKLVSIVFPLLSTCFGGFCKGWISDLLDPGKTSDTEPSRKTRERVNNEAHFWCEFSIARFIAWVAGFHLRFRNQSTICYSPRLVVLTTPGHHKITGTSQFLLRVMVAPSPNRQASSCEQVEDVAADIRPPSPEPPAEACKDGVGPVFGNL